MKKVSLLFIGVLMGLSLIAQPVVDNAIIPVAVNLNSILRLNVTSGGNIEFTINNIDQYTAGITNDARYDTKFTVASSVDFNVLMYAEGINLLGSDNTAHTLPTDNIGYTVESSGTGSAGGTNYTLLGDNGGETSDLNILTATSTTAIVTSTGGAGAGNIAKNEFIVHWELATAGVIAANTTALNLLAQSIAPDRYTSNVFLVLEPQ